MQLLSQPLPPMVPGPMPGRRRALMLLLAVLVLHGVLVFFGPRSGSGNGFDFFTFYLGARAPLTGLSPYDTEGVNYDHPAQHAAAAEFLRSCGITGEIPPGMYLPCGIYYPPQAFLIFLPFSRLPWNAALVAWTAFLTLMALPCGTLVWTFDENRRSPVLETGLIAAFLLNPLTQLMFLSGQVTLILV